MVRATSDLGSHGKHVCVSLHKNYLLPATTQIRGHMVSAFLFPPPCPLPPVTHHDSFPHHLALSLTLTPTTKLALEVRDGMS